MVKCARCLLKWVGESKMAKTFFGFALADSMFNGLCTIERRPLSVDEAKVLVSPVVSLPAPSLVRGSECRLIGRFPFRRQHISSGGGTAVIGISGTRKSLPLISFARTRK
jgi:hypothetical protein